MLLLLLVEMEVGMLLMLLLASHRAGTGRGGGRPGGRQLLRHQGLGEQRAVLQLVALLATGGPGSPHPFPAAQAGRRAALIRAPHRLFERPDVVVCKAQRFNFCKLCLVREGGKDGAQLFQRLVQRLHAHTLAIVGLGAPHLLHLAHLRGGAVLHPVLGAAQDGLPVEARAESAIKSNIGIR